MKRKNKIIISISVIALVGVYIWSGPDADNSSRTSFEFNNAKSNALSRTISSAPSRSVVRPVGTGKRQYKIKAISKFESRSKKSKIALKNIKYKQDSEGNFSTIKTAEKSYLLLENYYAIKLNDSNRAAYPNAPVKLAHLLVNELQRPPGALHIVENQETSRLAIFTGVISVKLKDFSMADSLITDVFYEVSNYYENIDVVHYQLSSFEDVMRVYSRLQSNSNVMRVKIELLEYSRR